MKTTKMSLANMQGKLSRVDMKNIIGGVVPPDNGGGTIYSANCAGTGCVGAWNYTTSVTEDQCHHDIELYCRLGCGGVCHSTY